MAFDITKQEILKQALEFKKLYDQTRNQTFKDQENRLRRIAVELNALTVGTSTVATLNDLTDVTISAPANAQVLTYNSTTSQWENQTPAGGGGTGDMSKSTYDVDNDGVVDSAETTQIIVRNSTGSTLTKGQVVYLSGATGNRPNALLSQANTEATSSKTIGIVVANIANNSDGYVAVSGTLHNLDTSAFADGAAMWLSATTAGGMTSTIPAEPNHTVFIGYVARSHPTAGRLIILIQNGYELNELHGVLVTSEANNDLLTYESSTGLWKNKTFSAIFGGTPLVSVPTLDQVTTAGNTTTNAITVGGLTVNTNLIYTDTVNGRVGIGTTSPSAKLDVNGQSIIGAGNKTNGSWPLYISDSSNLGWKVADSAGNAKFELYVGFSSINQMRLLGGVSLIGFSQNLVLGTSSFNSAITISNTTGNVLIGTTTDAGYMLDVNGTARITSNAIVSGSLGLGITSPAAKYHQYQTQGIMARYDISNANADQNRGVWDFYTNAATAPDFFGRFGFKFEGGITDSFKQFQINVASSTIPSMVVTGGGLVGIGTIAPTYKVEVQGTTLANSSVSVQGAFNINPLAAPPAIGGFTLSAGTNLGVGQYYYMVVYVTALGETNASPNLSVVTTAGNTTVNLTGIPVSSDARVTARKIYRTKVGGSTDNHWFLATISNNVTTTYTDSIADASLTGVGLQGYKINTTARYFTVSGTQGMVIDTNLTALGRNAGNAIITSNATAVRTVLIGASAGQNITTGTSNVIVGVAGANLTTGGNNTLVGDIAGYNLNIGYNNTIIGAQTGRYLTSGYNNIFIGPASGSLLADGTTQVTTAFQNIAIGRNARMSTINDSNSIIIGDTALGLGSNTTVIGNSSTTFTSIPAGNMTVGGTTNAGYKLDVTGTTRLNGLQTFQGTSASDTTSLGSELLTTGTGTNWTGTGFATGYIHTTGSIVALTTTLAAVLGNYYEIAATITGRTTGSIVLTFGGVSTLNRTFSFKFGLSPSTTGVLSITPTTDFDGTIVLSVKQITAQTSAITTWNNSSGTALVQLRAAGSNTALGNNAGRFITTNTDMSDNTFIGNNTGRVNVSSFNTFIGSNAGWSNTSGGVSILPPGNGGNTFVGAYSGYSNTIGHSNVFFGSNTAFNNTTGNYNIVLGSSIFYSNTTGSNNVAIGGYATLSGNINGLHNVAFGAYALETANASFNTAVGGASLRKTTSGQNNMALGYNALSENTTGSDNVAVGVSAGRYIADGATANAIANQSIFIGTLTKSNITNQTNQIVIGYNVTGLGTNTTVIGNSSTVTAAVYGNLLLGTTTTTGQKLQVVGNVFIKGSDTLSSTKVFEVQNGAGASIMDFRNATYAFFGCGQGGGSNSGFIFNYSNTSYTQFAGYNYGAGSGAYKPILMDTDIAGRGQGIFVNFGTATLLPPNSDTEFAVRGRTDDTTTYISRYRNSSNTDKFAVRADGALFTNTLQGYSGTLTIPTNPPGSTTITITNGLITNIT